MASLTFQQECTQDREVCNELRQTQYRRASKVNASQSQHRRHFFAAPPATAFRQADSLRCTNRPATVDEHQMRRKAVEERQQPQGSGLVRRGSSNSKL